MIDELGFLSSEGWEHWKNFHKEGQSGVRGFTYN